MEHLAIPAGERHPVHNWQWADATERLAESVVSGEIGCAGLQLDTHDLWRLVSVGPAVWKRVDGDRSYAHDQMSPAGAWTVTHNLGKYPSVTVIDSAGDEVEGHVNHVSANQLVLTFSAAFSGKAYLN